MAREIELKLGLPPEAGAKVCAHPLLQGVAPGQRLVSTYYDTPDLRLHRNGIALRVREVDGSLVQTVKCAGAVAGGLSDRPEWEQPWFGVFEFSGVDDRSVAVSLNAVASRLTPVFTTIFVVFSLPFLLIRVCSSVLIILYSGKNPVKMLYKEV